MGDRVSYGTELADGSIVFLTALSCVVLVLRILDEGLAFLSGCLTLLLTL